jgi:8-oxo-dGTP diphosphatase
MPKKQPALAVDAVTFDRSGKLLLIRRKNPPFKGRYALPGGFVDVGETVEQAAARELREEAGLKTKSQRLIGVYSDPKRDPRGHTVSVAFLIQVEPGDPKGGDDAASAEFVADWQTKKLAFDHNKIVADALRLRER